MRHNSEERTSDEHTEAFQTSTLNSAKETSDAMH